jgi:hypothetical protein
MTTKEASAYILPFGKYMGESLDQIAINHEDGPLYLDRLVGEDIDLFTKSALETFLKIPWVSELVNEAIEEREYS